MQEPEVSLWIAMKYIRDKETDKDIFVSIDGAHIKTKDTVHFDLAAFMCQNGYAKCGGSSERWQGEYESRCGAPRIIISSVPGVGDVNITLRDGSVLYIESKKFKSGSGGEYPAMREAIGQLMTGCPDESHVIPVVAVPHSLKSEALVQKWSKNNRIRSAGIRFMLVHEDGDVEYI